jgi:hypothetical protein
MLPGVSPPLLGQLPVAMTMYYLQPYTGITMRPVPQQVKDGSSQRAGWRRAFTLFDLVAQEGGQYLKKILSGMARQTDHCCAVNRYRPLGTHSSKHAPSP